MAEEQLELDCYHKAEEGEPKFTLIARDPLAAGMVALWAALRKGETASALSIFASIVADPAYDYRVKPNRDVSKLASACNISREMVQWREDKGLPVFAVRNVA